MKTLTVIPNHRIVRRPLTEGGLPLDQGKNEVPDNEYWRRRIDAKDVTDVTPKHEASGKQDVLVEEATPKHTTSNRRHKGEE